MVLVMFGSLELHLWCSQHLGLGFEGLSRHQLRLGQSLQVFHLQVMELSRSQLFFSQGLQVFHLQVMQVPLLCPDHQLLLQSRGLLTLQLLGQAPCQPQLQRLFQEWFLVVLLSTGQ